MSLGSKALLPVLLSLPCVAERYVVELSANSRFAEQAAAQRSVLQKRFSTEGIQVVDETVLGNTVIVEAGERGLARLLATPGVRRVHHDRLFSAQLSNSPEAYGTAWERAGGADQAGAGVKIAILDTGIDATHAAFQDAALALPEGFPRSDSAGNRRFLAGKVIVARSYERFNAKGFGSDAGDRQGHGTAAAMLAAGVAHESPQGPVSGAAPKALLGNYKVLGDNGGGSLSGLLKAIDDAVNDGMDILNLSLGDPRAPRASDDPVVRALESAIDRGVIVVTAAGNFGPQAGSVSSPGTTPRAITVGAVRSADGLVANYSGRGPVAGVGVKPEIVAPGDGLYCADSSLRAGSTGYRALAGTSLAAPIVAGAVAVLKAARPGLSPETYKSLLVASAASLPQTAAEGAGNGRLDLGAALASTIAPATLNVLNAFRTDYCKATPSDGLTVSPSEFAVAETVALEVAGGVTGVIALQCDSGTALRLPIWP